MYLVVHLDQMSEGQLSPGLVTAHTFNLVRSGIENQTRTPLILESNLVISSPCPSCGEAFVHELDDLGENVRHRVLRVHPRYGATCRACGSHWEPDELLFLAGLLGLELPPGLAI